MQNKIFLRSNSAWSESYSGHVTTNLVWFLPYFRLFVSVGTCENYKPFVGAVSPGGLINNIF